MTTSKRPEGFLPYSCIGRCTYGQQCRWLTEVGEDEYICSQGRERWVSDDKMCSDFEREPTP